MTRDQLAGLAKFEDIFSAPGFVFGSWTQAQPGADGVTDLGYYSLSEQGQAFYEAAYDLDWVFKFDWSSWMQTPRAQLLFDDPSLVASAPAAELRCMLTAAIRGDRFCEGGLAGVFNDGILTAIARRAGVLLAEMPAVEKPG